MNKFIITIAIIIIAIPTGWFLKVYPDYVKKKPLPDVDWQGLVDDESERLDFEITIPTRHFEKNAYPVKLLEKAGNINIQFNV